MTRRRVRVVCLLVAVGLALLAFCWRSEIIGRWNGESQYRGKYTNYWRSKLTGCVSYGGFPFVFRRPSLFEKLQAKLGLPGTSADYRAVDAPPLMVEGDPNALPVLVELLHDDEPTIRELAARGLRRIDRPALTYLRDAENDPDAGVREEVHWAIWDIERDKPPPLPPEIEKYMRFK